jgi:hypothetical protein
MAPRVTNESSTAVEKAYHTAKNALFGVSFVMNDSFGSTQPLCRFLAPKW